jgi:hypothetical protein
MNGKKAAVTTKRNNRSRRAQHRAPPRFAAGRDRQQDLGNWQRSRDRYLALARAAASSGDAIEAENCYQHAEHYFRLMRDRAPAAQTASISS